MLTLYKIKAHFGYKSQSYETYYVLAKDTTAAEKMVVSFHKKQSYSDVDFCHSETIAQTGDYGKPATLLT